ncbi:Metallo-dependent hydrolase [Viridothelium virens]|uniref:Metallo-dependent hydrolase n=1 Tax=Viridothelium virens TaxID=1048519 RepID=A0A6A6HLW0_VIRVR|nr:Metallo-dependent hydrolase [Viridothelium virens]
MPAGKVDYDLTTFFPLFSSYIYRLCSDVVSIQYATKSVLCDFEADNVVYLELRSTPRAVPTALPPITKTDYVDAILATIKAHNGGPGPLHTTLILSIDRRSTLEDALDTVDIAIARRAQGVVGIDLCGDPSKGTVSDLRPAFTKAHTAGLGVCVHFGEIPSADASELEEMLSWQPHRIGHAIYMPGEIKDEVRRRALGVELCLSCNVHAKMLPKGGGLEEHHFGEWCKDGRGAVVALCTDDVGVFCSPLSQEYYLAAKHFKLEQGDIQRLCEDMVGIVFAEEAEKDRLRDLYLQWFHQI